MALGLMPSQSSLWPWGSCQVNLPCDSCQDKSVILYILGPSIFYVYILTQQHAVTVIWMVFLPGWQTSLRYNGLWEVLFSPRSMFRGLAFTLTVTDAGQFVFIWRSSWWKHFSCNSKSDLEEKKGRYIYFI